MPGGGDTSIPIPKGLLESLLASPRSSAAMAPTPTASISRPQVNTNAAIDRSREAAIAAAIRSRVSPVVDYAAPDAATARKWVNVGERTDPLWVPSTDPRNTPVEIIPGLPEIKRDAFYKPQITPRPYSAKTIEDLEIDIPMARSRRLAAEQAGNPRLAAQFQRSAVRRAIEPQLAAALNPEHFQGYDPATAEQMRIILKRMAVMHPTVTQNLSAAGSASGVSEVIPMSAAALIQASQSLGVAHSIRNPEATTDSGNPMSQLGYYLTLSDS
jgi:hypothetical protein